jgi:hypothetical protein
VGADLAREPVGEEDGTELGHIIADQQAESAYERAAEILAKETLIERARISATGSDECSCSATGSPASVSARSTAKRDGPYETCFTVRSASRLVGEAVESR